MLRNSKCHGVWKSRLELVPWELGPHPLPPSPLVAAYPALDPCELPCPPPPRPLFSPQTAICPAGTRAWRVKVEESGAGGGWDAGVINNLELFREVRRALIFCLLFFPVPPPKIAVLGNVKTLLCGLQQKSRKPRDFQALRRGALEQWSLKCPVKGQVGSRRFGGRGIAPGFLP